jgi:hypothetical protein
VVGIPVLEGSVLMQWKVSRLVYEQEEATVEGRVGRQVSKLKKEWLKSLSSVNQLE